MSEEEVIKRRLIFDGDGTGEDRRLNVILKMITKWVYTSEETDDDSQITFDKILSQLALVEHCRKRSQLIKSSNSLQLDCYNALHAEYEDKISQIKEDITNQRDKLVIGKTVKQNRIQYDLLAKAIAKEPPRTDMNKKLEALQLELRSLGEDKKRLDQKLDLRRQDFSVLSTSANNLMAMLREDEELQMANESSSLDDINMNSPEPEPMSE